MAIEAAVDSLRVNEILEKYEDKEAALLPALQELQREFGWLSPEMLTQVARKLRIPPSKVYGVASFYTLFSTKKRGRHVIKICENAPCHVLGAQTIIKSLEKALEINIGETTPDGEFTLELTSCLGICGVGPVIDIDGETYGNLTPEQIPGILKAHLERGDEHK